MRAQVSLQLVAEQQRGSDEGQAILAMVKTASSMTLEARLVELERSLRIAEADAADTTAGCMVPDDMLPRFGAYYAARVDAGVAVGGADAARIEDEEKANKKWRLESLTDRNIQPTNQLNPESTKRDAVTQLTAEPAKTQPSTTDQDSNANLDTRTTTTASTPDQLNKKPHFQTQKSVPIQGEKVTATYRTDNTPLTTFKMPLAAFKMPPKTIESPDRATDPTLTTFKMPPKPDGNTT
jgi:hypothetical protein